MTPWLTLICLLNTCSFADDHKRSLLKTENLETSTERLTLYRLQGNGLHDVNESSFIHRAMAKKDSFPLKSLVTDTVCSRPVERCEAGEPRHLLAQLLPARGQVRTNNNGLLGTTSNIKLHFGFHLIPFYNCNSVRECEVWCWLQSPPCWRPCPAYRAATGPNRSTW